MATPLRTFSQLKRIGAFLGIRENVQTITLSGAASASAIATTIKPYGVTVINSTGTGASHRVPLARPRLAGVRKTIILKLNSTNDVIVVNATTTDKFYGSTVNSALFSTAAGARGQGNLQLVAISTAQWALLSQRGTTLATQYPFTLQNSTA